MKLRMITPPSTLPVDVALAKQHSRILGEQEDDLVALYLSAATAELDGPTGVVGKCFMTQVWQMELVGWVGPLALRVEPVSSIEVRYVDAQGSEQVLPSSGYVLDDDVSRSPRLHWRGSMPVLGNDPWPVRIVITAGHEQADPDVQVAILLRAAQLYEHREAQITGAIVAVNPAYDAIVGKIRRKL